MSDANDKYKLQDRQYGFPYHHIPYFDEAGTPRRFRVLSWGMEYLCYLRQVTDYVLAQRPRTLLDVGCGDGRLVGLLAQHIDTVVGCDLSSQAIAFARAFYPQIDFRIAEPGDLRENFDVVTAIEVLEHVPDAHVASFLRSVSARTADGGAVILSVPSVVTEVSAKHFRHYDEELLNAQVTGAEAQLVPISMVRLLRRRDIVYRVFRRLTTNRMINLEVPLLNKLMWHWLWSRRFDSTGGLQIVAIFRKEPI